MCIRDRYGPIPDGALVALRSDWYKKWPDMDALSGIDAEGKENAPGWSLEALEYIYKVRNAAANGHETLDTDSSAVAEEKSAVPVWLKEVWQRLFPADAPASSEPEPVSSEEVLPASEAALPPEETETEPETEGAAE